MDLPILPPLEYIGEQAIYSPPHADFLLIMVKEGYSLRAACGAASIPYRVASQWVNMSPAFRIDIEVALAQRVFQLERRLLNTEDPTQGKILMQALRRCAPEVWADPKEAPPDVTQIPNSITLTVIQPEPRLLPKAVQEIAPNAPFPSTTQ